MNSITRRAFVQAGVAATLASGASLAGAERAQGQIAASPQIDFTGDGIPLSAAEYAQLLARLTTSGTELDEYSRGGPVAALEHQFATLLGKEAAVFMPSGIMAQLAAVRVWTERARLPRFGMHPTSHLANHEEEAHVALLRLHGVPVGDRLRPIVAADLESVRQDLACLIVELPLRESGAQLPTWDELEALKTVARERGMPLAPPAAGVVRHRRQPGELPLR